MDQPIKTKIVKKTSSVVCLENFPASYKLSKKKPFEIDRKASLIKKSVVRKKPVISTYFKHC